MRAKRRVQVQIRMRLNQFGLIPSVFSRVMTRQRAEWFLRESKSAALKHSIEYLMNQWVELEKEIKRINLELVKQAQSDPCEAVYRSVPGIGPLIARVLSNELGDLRQFPNERALFQLHWTHSRRAFKWSEYQARSHITPVEPPAPAHAGPSAIRGTSTANYFQEI
jgi:transposase